MQDETSMQGEYKKVSDENLEILIEGLEEYKSQGVFDPWVLEDGTIVEPLHVLKELQDLRELIEISDAPTSL